MGVKLSSYFDKVNAKGGLQAKVKFAMLTKMSQQQSLEAPDSPENIKLFDAAMEKMQVL